MGGGGTYYDRDVTTPDRRMASGYSDLAQEAMNRRSADIALKPEADRALTTKAASPLVYAFDVTGSMGNLPMIIFDKMPMMAGQLSMNEYLTDAQISVAAVGDVTCDYAPLQVADFSEVRNLDEWLTKLYIEKGGGGNEEESYEMIAYYYAKYCDVSAAQMPIFLITGDEGFSEDISAATLQTWFGGSHESTTGTAVFRELLEKFQGNVFIIRRKYGKDAANERIDAQWREALGDERVVNLPDDVSIADVTLGVLAIASGARTLDAYIEDVRSRPLDLGGDKFEAQSEERITAVRKALEPFAERFVSSVASATDAVTSTQKTESGTDAKKRPGRI